MELKAIIYIIGGIAYLIYNFYGKREENKPTTTVAKKKDSGSGKTIEEVLAEIERGRKKAHSVSTSAPTVKKQIPKKIFIEEKENAEFVEGKSAAVLYEDYAGNVEGVSTIKPIDMNVKDIEVATEEKSFSFNAKEAFIGSIIFERKF